jgi:sugar/nucleoside kinase (ribokinase family)
VTGARRVPREAERERPPFDVVGLGECSADRVLLVDGIPGPGGKQRILRAFDSPGGQVATALLACARLGLRGAFLGAVGDDAAAATVLAPLLAAGIDLADVRHVAGAETRSAVILVEARGGERAVLHRRDARLALEPGHLRREAVRAGRVLYVDAGDPEASAWAAGVAREAAIPVVLDADAVRPGIDALLEVVDFPIVSREFAEEYGGTRSPADGLRALAARGARFAVVTLGDRGAIGSDGERVLESPAFPVTVRDTTGAGDVFHAAFVWGLLQGLEGAALLRAANAAAAMSCRAFGAQGGLPDRGALEAFLREREDVPPPARAAPGSAGRT